MRDLANISMPKAEFEELAALCEHDPRFPRTWADWVKLQEEVQQQGSLLGRTPLDLSVADFQRWCGLVGIIPGIDALRAYAIVRRTSPALLNVMVPPAAA